MVVRLALNTCERTIIGNTWIISGIIVIIIVNENVIAGSCVIYTVHLWFIVINSGMMRSTGSVFRCISSDLFGGLVNRW